ncbi:unnamed protein product [Heligmosomoides polygyrus]|uniref:Phosphoglycerate mutase n=1 Tax=Heligmosomoides polygyrus TaxID=6339 RepID=A0A183GGC8_HELPZ|nr:unnamed protein product [Heligmosomoides polygyrus]
MSGRSILVIRHGERCDFVFNSPGVSWMRKAFDSNGRYCPTDINMPRIVPKRKDGWENFAFDVPLTEMGYIQSKLTGRALRDSGIKIDFIYCSSALRCVQTAVGITKGLVHVQSMPVFFVFASLAASDSQRTSVDNKDKQKK